MVQRSHRDDETEAGVATVSCVEVNDVTARLGAGPVSKLVGQRMMEEAQEKAKNGVAWERENSLWPDTDPVRDNDFRMHLELMNVPSALEMKEQDFSRSN